MEVKFSPIYLRQQPKSVDLRVMEEEEIDEKVDEKAKEEVYLGREPKSVEIREKKRSGAGARTFTNFSFIARGLFQTHIYNLFLASSISVNILIVPEKRHILYRQF